MRAVIAVIVIASRLVLSPLRAESDGGPLLRAPLIYIQTHTHNTHETTTHNHTGEQEAGGEEREGEASAGSHALDRQGE